MDEKDKLNSVEEKPELPAGEAAPDTEEKTETKPLARVWGSIKSGAVKACGAVKSAANKACGAVKSTVKRVFKKEEAEEPAGEEVLSEEPAAAPVSAETAPEVAAAELVPAMTVAEETAPEGEQMSEIEAATMRTLSPSRMVLKRFFRSKLSVTGLVILIALFVFSFIGPLFEFLPFIWPEQQSDYSVAVREEYAKPVTVTGADGEDYTVYVVTYSEPKNHLPPSWEHWLGTDDKGFDVFTRLMYGGRISLTVGFVVVILETVIGVFLGGLAGYFGKWVDQIIMRIVDIFNCVPTMPMLMIVGVSLEANQIDGVAKLYIMMAMLTLFGWAGTARLVRGQILSLREQEFMISAEASGLPVWRKIFKHLIPNVMPQLIVSMTLGLGGIILTEATLGYLNIGLPAVYATWGNMINAAANNTALTLYPNLWVSPGICIVLAVLAFNFVGDGLRDAFDPKARR